MSAEQAMKPYSPGAFQDKNVNPVLRAAIDIVSDAMSDELISNHNIVDAWYLFKKIFEMAAGKKLPVTLVTGCMRADFYNALMPQLGSLVEAQCSLRAYLLDTQEPDVTTASEGRNEFAECLEDQGRQRPELYKLKYLPIQIPHIVYAGQSGEAFRIETDSETHAAFASFGPRLGRRIVGAVNKLISKEEERMDKSD